MEKKREELTIKLKNRIKQNLTSPNFSKLLPPELIPTLNFYLAILRFDDTLSERTSKLQNLSQSLSFDVDTDSPNTKTDTLLKNDVNMNFKSSATNKNSSPVKYVPLSALFSLVFSISLYFPTLFRSFIDSISFVEQPHMKTLTSLSEPTSNLSFSFYFHSSPFP